MSIKVFFQNQTLTNLVRQPVFMCGFRPFYLLTAGSAIVLMLLWLAVWCGYLPLDFALVGGVSVTAWHAHEFLFGFCAAALAGFLLTAVPEFTATTSISRQGLLLLVLLWLLARLSFSLQLWLTLWPAWLFSFAFDLALLSAVAPATIRLKQGKHISFAYALSSYVALHAGFFVSVIYQGEMLAWLYAVIGVLMVMVILATSRISMRVVNRKIESGRRQNQPLAKNVQYLARPPRLRLTIVMLVAATSVEFFLGDNPVTGWLFLAVAAAVLNMLNDWHIGKGLFFRWSLMLYSGYLLMALGYALLGGSYLGLDILPSAARHLLTAGVLSLAIFTVMEISGRIHAGLWLDRRIWLPIAVALIILASLLRLLAGTTWIEDVIFWMLLSGLVWLTAFGLFLYFNAKTLFCARSDQRDGCQGPMAEVINPNAGFDDGC